VKLDWLRRYSLENLPPWQFTFQSWDTASKPQQLSDFCVCTTWAVIGQDLYLIDVLRERMGYPALKRAVCAQAERHNAGTILIEEKGSGIPLIQELQYDARYNVKAYVPQLDKQVRLFSVCSMIENGLVHIPEKAPWLDCYVNELTAFPKSKFDDQVDSTSQALNWFWDSRHKNQIWITHALI
jgi:predicted phage terminase large subunit-like protein